MQNCKFFIFFLLSIFIASCSDAAKIPDKPWHHTSKGFRNPEGSPKKKSWINRFPWIVSRPFKLMFFGIPKLPPEHVMKKKEVVHGLKATAGKDTVTWLGHMTALLRIDGKSILTDPWLTSHASPVRPLGPKRYVKPALTTSELPPINFIVISHSHFDHLDLPTIEAIPNREKITAIVPLGIGKYFKEYGYKKIIELDWEKSVTEDGISFTALPVIHWSKRSVFSTNDTLWTGWAIKGAGGTRVFFAGDAEYSSVYQDIAKRHGGFDLSLLSIGAFLPRVVMHGSHCVPEDCIKIGNDMGAKNHLGMHWGTAPLGDDTPLEALRRFRNGAKTLGIPAGRVWIMKIGETRIIE
ncbi:MAG: MBL fold metallo-hydrolase [Nitrospinota bacterium]|nr:MBL fold metallo-hydrolase [Nitrospinota bacterium]